MNSIPIKLDVCVRLPDCLPDKLNNGSQMRLNSRLVSLGCQPLKLVNNLYNLGLIENGVACWINEPQTRKLAGVKWWQESLDEKSWVAQLGQLLSSLIFPA